MWREFVKKLNKKYLKWSLLICIVLTLFIPSEFASKNDWRGSYHFGFPLEYITIYQHEPYSSWLFTNLFNGNSGMHINGGLFINVMIFYLILRFIVNKFIDKDRTVSD